MAGREDTSVRGAAAASGKQRSVVRRTVTGATSTPVSTREMMRPTCSQGEGATTRGSG
jgi:hypothetical protein